MQTFWLLCSIGNVLNNCISWNHHIIREHILGCAQAYITSILKYLHLQCWPCLHFMKSSYYSWAHLGMCSSIYNKRTRALWLAMLALPAFQEIIILFLSTSWDVLKHAWQAH
jgi:hypothetical protein